MKSVILIVLDGFGIASPGQGNAIYLANPEIINSYLYTYPNTTLKASSEAVGLPSGEVGNTEVGHLNLGAGRVVFQDLPKINMSIADGEFYQNQVFFKVLDHLKQTNGNLHLLGLVGEGTVHSSIDHLYALLNFAKLNNFLKVFLHAITDGRDSPPKSSIDIISRIEEQMAHYGVGKIASVMGRYYAMDRDLRWERIEKAYFCLTRGSEFKSKTALEAIEKSYKDGKTDEFIEPTSILIDNNHTLIKENDAVIFFNYRVDRPRELTKAFVLDNFNEDANKSGSYDPYESKYHKSHIHQKINASPVFDRGEKVKNLIFVTMTEYEKSLPVQVAYPPMVVRMPLGRVLSEHGVQQLRMAESEKERFVSYYFNGLRENPFPLEDKLIIPSPKVPTYDLKPEMSSFELTEALINSIKTQKYKFILINFANPDMVGHTGSIEASIKAIKSVDTCLDKITKVALNTDYTILITADHGNVEQKINPQTGQISTEHTANPVPFIAVSRQFQGRFAKLNTGILSDVAPTILGIMGIPKPAEMTGRNLLEDIES